MRYQFVAVDGGAHIDATLGRVSMLLEVGPWAKSFRTFFDPMACAIPCKDSKYVLVATFMGFAYKHYSF